jgi:hypothetical protein
VGAGTFAGFGYTLDGGSGPLLLLAAIAAVALRTRRIGPVVLLGLAAAPWVAAHHLLNYHVGRVWVPLGMVPEYLAWPGSPFDRSNLTGFARHTPGSFVAYAWNLLFGREGFLLFNLPLLLAVGFGWRLMVRPGIDQPELAVLIGWCIATWLLYALLSDNSGGGCLTVRWFIPFLVPGYWLLARMMREWPAVRWDVLVLSAWSLVVSWIVWPLGPWPLEPVPEIRGLVLAALASWGGLRLGRWLVHGSLCRSTS